MEVGSLKFLGLHGAQLNKSTPHFVKGDIKPFLGIDKFNALSD